MWQWQQQLGDGGEWQWPSGQQGGIAAVMAELLQNRVVAAAVAAAAAALICANIRILNVVVTSDGAD